MKTIIVDAIKELFYQYFFKFVRKKEVQKGKNQMEQLFFYYILYPITVLPPKKILQ